MCLALGVGNTWGFTEVRRGQADEDEISRDGCAGVLLPRRFVWLFGHLEALALIISSADGNFGS